MSRKLRRLMLIYASSMYIPVERTTTAKRRKDTYVAKTTTSGGDIRNAFVAIGDSMKASIGSR